MKKFISGFIAGALLFGTVGVFAAGGSMLEVFYTVKDIKINKVSQMPEQKPFVVNGTTYVPLRYVSEKLGYPVKWEQKTQTIWIGATEEATAVYPDGGIEYMNYQKGSDACSFKYDYNSNTKIKDNLGNEYANYLIMYVERYMWENTDRSWNYIEFPLNSQYKRFKAKLGLTDKYKSTVDSIKLEILLDDSSVYTKELKAGDMLTDIDLDISNSNKITFKVSSSGFDESELGLFDARFIK